MLSNIRDDLNDFLPLVVIWGLRIFLGVQTYLYHNSLSMLHLIWVLSSFIVPQQVILFLSATIMIPVYTWEFVMIYGERIPIVNKYFFFTKYGSYFSWKLEYPITE